MFWINTWYFPFTRITWHTMEQCGQAIQRVPDNEETEMRAERIHRSSSTIDWDSLSLSMSMKQNADCWFLFCFLRRSTDWWPRGDLTLWGRFSFEGIKKINMWHRHRLLVQKVQSLAEDWCGWWWTRRSWNPTSPREPSTSSSSYVASLRLQAPSWSPSSWWVHWEKLHDSDPPVQGEVWSPIILITYWLWNIEKIEKNVGTKLKWNGIL